MEFSRQASLSGLPFPSPRDLPNPGIEPGSPALQADSLPSEPQGDPGSVPGLGRSPGEGNGYLLQHPILENSMDRAKESDTPEQLTFSLSQTWKFSSLPVRL